MCCAGGMLQSTWPSCCRRRVKRKGGGWASGRASLTAQRSGAAASYNVGFFCCAADGLHTDLDLQHCCHDHLLMMTSGSLSMSMARTTGMFGTLFAHMRPPTHPPSTAVRLRTSVSIPDASYSRCRPAPRHASHQEYERRPLLASSQSMSTQLHKFTA